MAIATATEHDRKWPEMERGEKMVWVVKFVIALCTFGFAFPRVMDPHIREDR